MPRRPSPVTTSFSGLDVPDRYRAKIAPVRNCTTTSCDFIGCRDFSGLTGMHRTRACPAAPVVRVERQGSCTDLDRPPHHPGRPRHPRHHHPVDGRCDATAPARSQPSSGPSRSSRPDWSRSPGRRRPRRPETGRRRRSTARCRRDASRSSTSAPRPRRPTRHGATPNASTAPAASASSPTPTHRTATPPPTSCPPTTSRPMAAPAPPSRSSTPTTTRTPWPTSPSTASSSASPP